MTEKTPSKGRKLKNKIQNLKSQSIAVVIGFTDTLFPVANTLSFNTLKFKLNSSPTWGHDDSCASSVMNNIIIYKGIGFKVSDVKLNAFNISPDI